MFEGPEFASYVELCRALRLERKWGNGDWFCWLGEPTEVTLYHRGWVTEYGPHDIAEWAWLPRLDQWLAMLEEADLAYVMFGRNNRDVVGIDEPDGRVYYCRPDRLLEQIGLVRLDPKIETFAATREEAAARLWLAVTGREAPRA